MKLSRRNVLAGTTLAAIPCLAAQATAEDIGKSDLPKDAIILAVVLKAKPGEEQAVKEALLSMVEPTRKEAGCLCYNLHESKSDKGQFMFYEQWASQAALDAHAKSPHMKALGDKLKDRTEKGDFTSYELLK